MASTSRPVRLATSVLLAVAASPSLADTAFNNFGPGDSFTGSGWAVRGPEASPPFTQAFRFVAGASGPVTTVAVAIHHLENTNDYIFEIRSDAGGQPGPIVGTLGEVAGFISGTVPVQFQATPGTVLASGTTYWFHARGTADAMGTCRASPTPGGIRAISLDGGQSWSVAVVDPPGGIAAFRLEVGGSACYANCDGSTAAPVLNVQDFGCFLQKFAAGDAYANCDASTTAPTLNVQDFSCFLQKFVTGCP